MSNTFLIIDDDISVVKMLEEIIKNNNLGKVVGVLNSGEHAKDEILFYNPDIVLIDYLLPYKDGSDIIKELIEDGYNGKVIMISQVENPKMIANAYNAGILFFIKKPINVIEVINVIKNISHNIELEKSMSIIKNVLGNINEPNTSLRETDTTKEIEGVLSEIGIIGDIGSSDIIKLIQKVMNHKRIHSNSSYKLQELYIEMATEETSAKATKINPNTIEQRIRRAIQKSLSNIAEMGLDDYYNSVFAEYSTLLFDFKQVKQEMNYIQNLSKSTGKVNTRKFIEGIISKINE